MDTTHRKRFFAIVQYLTKKKIFWFREDTQFKTIEDCKKYIEEELVWNIPLSNCYIEYRETLACPNCNDCCLHTKPKKNIKLSNDIKIFLPCSTSKYTYWIEPVSSVGRETYEKLNSIIDNFYLKRTSITSLQELVDILMKPINTKKDVFSPEETLKIISLKEYVDKCLVTKK